MTVKTTKTPKGPTTAAPASGHGCCGGDAATKSQSEIVNPSDLAALGHTKPLKAAESCCCGGAGKK